MKRRNEKGQAILEMAMVLPILILIMLGMIDLQWLFLQAGDLEYVTNEVARCESIGHMNPVTPGLTCPAGNGGAAYANTLIANLHLNPGQFTVLGTPGCPGTTVAPAAAPPPGTCSFEASYQFRPLGIYFPKPTLVRTGIASTTP